MGLRFIRKYVWVSGYLCITDLRILCDKPKAYTQIIENPIFVHNLQHKHEQIRNSMHLRLNCHDNLKTWDLNSKKESQNLNWVLHLSLAVEPEPLNIAYTLTRANLTPELLTMQNQNQNPKT